MSLLLLEDGLSHLLLEDGSSRLALEDDTSGRVAIIVTLSDAVSAAINGAALSQSITASRAYRVTRRLDAIDSAVASVLPETLAVGVWDLSRNLSFAWNVTVWIQRRTNGEPSQVDGLMLLCEEIIQLFAGKPLGTTSAQCIGVENRPACDYGKLEEKGLFESVLIFTFRKILNP